MTVVSSVTAGALALVEEAVELNSKAVSRQDIASRVMARARNREEIEEAYLLWLRRVHLLPSGDFEAIAVLRALERALMLSPRLPGFGAAPRGI